MADESTASDDNFKTPSPAVPRTPWCEEGWIRPVGVSISAILISSFLIWGGVTLSSLPHSLAELKTAIKTNSDSLNTKIDTKIDSQRELLEQKIVSQRLLLEQKVENARDVLDTRMDHLDDKIDNQSALLNSSITGVEKQLEALLIAKDGSIGTQQRADASDDLNTPRVKHSLTHVHLNGLCAFRWTLSVIVSMIVVSSLPS